MKGKIHSFFQSPLGLSVIVYTIILGIEIIALLALNSGTFIFTLDDAYIHLAVAENIFKGHYGVNLGEFSAPSSSILWPFLVSPFSLIGWDAFIPVIIGYFSSVGILWTSNSILSISLDGVGDQNRKKRVIFIFLVFLILAVNLVGLPLTGMEHTLQVWLSVSLLWGLIREQRTGKVSGWLGWVIVLGPLVRYEGLTLSGLALIYLSWRRHYRTVIISALALVSALLIFTFSLQSMGLGWLPGSVLVKSGFGWEPQGIIELIMGLMKNLRDNLYTRQMVLLSGGAFLLFSHILFNPRSGERFLAGWALAGALFHILVGKFGFFSRYEMYVWGVVLLANMYIYRGLLRRMVDFHSDFKIGLCLGAFLVFLTPTYLSPLFRSPLGSNNIYEQQYQMHRFVTEYYQAPVAVRDLGWVAYRNDQYVLDLGGLASRQVLYYSKIDQNIPWIDQLARERDIKLIILSPGSLSGRIENWRPVANLYLGKPKVTSSSNLVVFYVQDEVVYDDVKALLEAFQDSLPDGVRLVFESQ